MLNRSMCIKTARGACVRIAQRIYNEMACVCVSNDPLKEKPNGSPGECFGYQCIAPHQPQYSLSVTLQNRQRWYKLILNDYLAKVLAALLITKSIRQFV